MSHRILITIEASGERIDLAVPPHSTAVDLLTWIEQAVAPSGEDGHRSLVMPDGSTIDDAACLASAGVLDGMTLRAATLRQAPQRPETTPRPTTVPDLPAALSMSERLLVALRALVGLIHPTGARGPWARAVEAWQWSDHDRRLRWLIGRPKLARGTTISVLGHRSAEVVELLALAFASTRPEPVVLVDHDPSGTLSRHLDGSRVCWDALARDLADPTLGWLQRDRLLTRSPAGLRMAPSSEEADGRIETVLHALTRHGAIVIIDEGPTPKAAPVGDHVVNSSIGDTATSPGDIVVAWRSRAPAVPAPESHLVPIDGRPYRMLEIAAAVAGRWAMSEPARSDDRQLG